LFRACRPCDIMDSIVVTYSDNYDVKPKKRQISKYTVQSGEKRWLF